MPCMQGVASIVPGPRNLQKGIEVSWGLSQSSQPSTGFLLPSLLVYLPH